MLSVGYFRPLIGQDALQLLEVLSQKENLMRNGLTLQNCTVKNKTVGR